MAAKQKQFFVRLYILLVYCVYMYITVGLYTIIYCWSVLTAWLSGFSKLLHLEQTKGKDEWRKGFYVKNNNWQKTNLNRYTCGISKKKYIYKWVTDKRLTEMGHFHKLLCEEITREKIIFSEGSRNIISSHKRLWKCHSHNKGFLM